jgi:hypothetical protein
MENAMKTHLYALALIALAFVPLSKKEQASSLRSSSYSRVQRSS